MNKLNSLYNNLHTMIQAALSLSSINMHTLLSLQLWTYHSQHDVGGDGDEQGEECVDD